MDKIKEVKVNSDEGYEIIGYDGSIIVTGVAKYNFKLISKNFDEVKFECITDNLPPYSRGDVLIIDKYGNYIDKYIK